MNNIYIYVIIFILSLLSIGTTALLAKKRRKDMEIASKHIGFSYAKVSDQDILSSVKGFNLCCRGHSAKAYNIMEGNRGFIEWTVFDYSYSYGGNRTATTNSQTVAYTQSVGFNLPEFLLKPKKHFDTFRDILCLRDVCLDSHPDFSKKYILKGLYKEKVRKLFNPQIIHYLENKKDRIYVEANGSKIIIYKHNNKLKPQQIHAFLIEASKIVNLLQKSARKL